MTDNRFAIPGYPGPAPTPAAPAAPAVPHYPGFRYDAATNSYVPDAAPQAPPPPAAPAPQAPAAPPAFAQPAYIPEAPVHPNPGAQAPAQAPPAYGGMQGALRGATMGGERLPLLTSGRFRLAVEKTYVGQSGTLIATCVVMASDSDAFPVGSKIHELFPLNGKDQKQARARQSALMRFLVRVFGCDTLEQAEAHPHWAAMTAQLDSEPGPLVGRQVDVVVHDSGKRTKDGEILYNKAWSVAR